MQTILLLLLSFSEHKGYQWIKKSHWNYGSFKNTHPSLHQWTGGGGGRVVSSGNTYTVVELLAGFVVDQLLVIGLRRTFCTIRSKISKT